MQGKPLELYVMQGHEVDEVSMDLAPGDLTGNIKFPIKIIGDGICLPPLPLGMKTITWK